MPKLGISIIKLEPRRMGEEVELSVRIAPTDGAEGDRCEHRKMCVASKMLFEIGNIGVGSLPYALSEEQFDNLEYSARLWEVIKKGFDLLAFGDNTKSALTTKLRQRGFDRDLCAEAAEYIAELGYINESRILENTVAQLANVKLYGPTRIKNEVRKKGISEDIIRLELRDLLDGIDFEANLVKILRRKCDFSRLGDMKYRQSLYASLYRLGYSPSDSASAIKFIQENKDE